MGDSILNPQQSQYGLAILLGLGDHRKHVARRRAKNRVARRSRAINRAA